MLQKVVKRIFQTTIVTDAILDREKSNGSINRNKIQSSHVDSFHIYHIQLGLQLAFFPFFYLILKSQQHSILNWRREMTEICFLMWRKFIKSLRVFCVPLKFWKTLNNQNNIENISIWDICGWQWITDASMMIYDDWVINNIVRLIYRFPSSFHSDAWVEVS